MKKLLIAILLLVSSLAQAKMVHFVVDMSQQTVNVTGVHIVGDFQTIAGFAGGDWNSASTPMTQMATDTNMYEVYVDVPAFAKYEYKFVNGDQFYEAEFVPVESRVGYNFNDNRWIYVDSIANDTSYVGAILFAGNAPLNKVLVRYLVDLASQPSVNSNGVHLIANYQSFNPIEDILYSFGSNVYEVINYVDVGTYQYRYLNGNNAPSTEIVPSSCADPLGYRMVIANADIVLPVDCFAGCGACSTSGINEVTHASFNVFPNPVKDQVSIRFANEESRTLLVTDLKGKVILNEKYQSDIVIINTTDLPAGKYNIQSIGSVNNKSDTSSFIKLN